MLPSLLARDIHQGLRQFLLTGFEASDDFMSGVMERFVHDPSGWLKGPYLQLGLPFTQGLAGKGFFKGFETEYPGFSHQEAAWQRLSSQHMAASTLVATGTGSGPVLTGITSDPGSTSLVLTFDGPLRPDTATDLANYRITAPTCASPQLVTSSGPAVKVVAARYSDISTTSSQVTLTLARPLWQGIF